MKNFKRSVNGITLIALVVTIIILLILASITIAILTGENGFLKRTGKASETVKDVTEEERVKLAVSSAFIEDKGTISTENLKNELKSEFGEENVKDNLEGVGPWSFKGERKTYIIDKKRINRRTFS